MKKLKKIKKNLNLSFEGVMPNGKGFLLSFEEANEIIKQNPKNRDCIKYYLNGHDLNHRPDQSASRMIIDFQNWSLEKAMEYKECFEIIEKKVKPDRLSKNFTGSQIKKIQKYWWKFERFSPKMRQQLKPLKQFIVISKTSKHIFFIMINNKNIIPSNLCIVIASEKFSFMGILSSKIHIVWVKYQGSSLGNGPRYTNTTCFETFPFPYYEKIT
jgi:hypothetical protein